MDFQLKFDLNDKIYLRNPENSEIGKQIIKKSIDLIYELGFEHFTFKKLAIEMGSTEATVYRYFVNKHRLLLYILNWYWSYMEFLLEFNIKNVTDATEKLKIVIQLLTQDLSTHSVQSEYNTNYLNHIVNAEGSKAYLIKEISEINKEEVFKPYKDLCAKIADLITAYRPDYPFPHSLATTIIETSHQQQYFSQNLPRLTDVQAYEKNNFTQLFLEDLLFKVLG